MTAAQQIPLVSVEDYLAAELDGEVRHEYVGGYVHAMAGAKNAHNDIAANFLVSVGSQLHGRPCKVCNSDVKARVKMPTHTRFYYPDGMVVCEPNPPEETFQDRPVVIAEVLSEATSRVDTLEKRDAYLSIPTLAVYLLIETDSPRVSVYRRQTPGEGLGSFNTELHEGVESTISLEEVSAELRLAELYERVEFSTAG